jgi:heme/copper-type cytochrome/quinol oxidase subunit 4
MKKIDGYWKEQDDTDMSDDTNSQLGKQSSAGTVVGFKQEFTIPPMSRWGNRFIIAAIVQGALAAGLTGYLLAAGIGWLGGVPASKIVAAGGAGTWLTVGYLTYIILGPIAVAVTALFYQHLETGLRSPYTGWTKLMAWAHILLMNIGVVGATWLMMNAGFRGGAAAFPVSQGGLGYNGANAGFVHTNIMQYYPPYIAAFIAIAIAGAFLGGLGYVIIWRRSLKASVRSVA